MVHKDSFWMRKACHGPRGRPPPNCSANFPFPPRSVAVDTPGRRLGARAAPVGVDGRVGGYVGRRPVRPGGVAHHEATLFADAVLRHETLRVAAASARAADQGISVAGAPPLGNVAPSSAAAATRSRSRRGVIYRGN